MKEARVLNPLTPLTDLTEGEGDGTHTSSEGTVGPLPPADKLVAFLEAP
jgi:hypothetical protein